MTDGGLAPIVPMQANSSSVSGWLESAPIAVLGDTQPTLAVERWLLRREQNDAERPRLIADLLAWKPALLVHLGDMVADGARRSDWSDFDQLVAPIRAAGVPILPALGNHDYAGGVARFVPAGRRAALRHLHARFPWLSARRWYDRQQGPLRLVWLDTNSRRMPAADWAEQVRWFESKLAEAEADGRSRGILVFAHHPPFTNSRATSDALDVRRAFVGPFCRSAKGLLFLSGHTHAYERFHESGKTFVVAGGGGGPRVRLLRGNSRRHLDRIDAPSPRPFHYLLVRAAADGVDVIARGMDKGAATTAELDRFFIPYASAPDRPPPGAA